MSSNREYFNSQSEAIRETAMCADGETASPIVPENNYSPLIDVAKTIAACGGVLLVGMGLLYGINLVTKTTKKNK